MAKNIEMNYKQGESEYEVLYPQTVTENVVDINNYFYTKDEITGITSTLIPSPYGMIVIKVVDEEGNPQAVDFSISPGIGENSDIKSFSTADNGMYVSYAQAGSYTISPPAGGDFISYVPSTATLEVNENEVAEQEFTISAVASGRILYKSSTTINIPSNFPYTFDLFLCGGGGTGALEAQQSQYGVSGGGGGYTVTKKNVDLSGKQIKITVGSGGASSVATFNGQRSYTGKKGGNSKIVIELGETYTASGGKGGVSTEIRGSSNVYIPTRTTSFSDGGSGGAGIYVNVGTSGRVLARTAYYSHGGADVKSPQYGGDGQGRTTRMFEDPSEILCCSGGGCVGDYYARNTDDVVTTFASLKGGEGATDGYYSQSASDKAPNATGYGNGSGGMRGYVYNQNTKENGAGAPGVVAIRWPSR